MILKQERPQKNFVGDVRLQVVNFMLNLPIWQLKNLESAEHLHDLRSLGDVAPPQPDEPDFLVGVCQPQFKKLLVCALI